MRVFLDTAPIVYVVEWHSTFGPPTAGWLAANATTYISSEFSRAESLIRPLRIHDAVRLRDFETFFSTRVHELKGCDRQVFDRAAGIRAASNFKLIDSIQLAIAIEASCDVFLTNDLRLKRFSGIRIEVP